MKKIILILGLMLISSIAVAEESVEFYLSRGYEYYYKGEYDKAIEDYTKAIELDPNNAGAYNNRGVAYGRKRQYDRAIEDYTKAIELDPNNAGAYYNRGFAYTLGFKGQYGKAVEDFTKAIELNPNYDPFYYDRGSVYDEKGKYNNVKVKRYRNLNHLIMEV